MPKASTSLPVVKAPIFSIREAVTNNPTAPKL